jgi:hypothetical protein
MQVLRTSAKPCLALLITTELRWAALSSPPAKKAAASENEARKTSTGDGTGDRCGNTNWEVSVVRCSASGIGKMAVDKGNTESTHLQSGVGSCLSKVEVVLHKLSKTAALVEKQSGVCRCQAPNRDIEGVTGSKEEGIGSRTVERRAAAICRDADK